MEKNKFISDKIKELKSEGYSTAQATAIAYKKWREVPKAQQGTFQINPPMLFEPQYNFPTTQQTNKPREERSYKPYTSMFPLSTPPSLRSVENNQFETPQQTVQTPPQQIVQTPSQKTPQNFDDAEESLLDFETQQLTNFANKLKEKDDFDPNYIYDSNVAQMKSMQAKIESQQPQGRQNTEVQNFLNPYGGVDPMGGLIFGANAAGRGKTGQAALGFARFGLGALREGMSAYASGKATQDAFEYNRNELYRPTEGVRGQEGGKTVAQVVAGNYITNNPFEYNIELEGKEYVKSPDGQIQEVFGEKHVDGGVKANVEEGSKILSNYTKIGKENAKYFEENYGLKLKPNDTFSKIQRLLDRKLGLDKVEKEEAKVIKEIEKNSKLKDSATQKLNNEVLADELKAAQMKKDEVSSTRQVIFEDAFERQEMIPKKGDGSQVLDSNGNPTEVKEENYFTELAEKYQIDPQRAKELRQEGGMQEQQMMMQQIAQALQEGADPNQILQQLVESGVPQEQAIQIVESIMQQMQAQQEQMMPQEQEMMMMMQEEQMMQQGGVLKAQEANMPKLDDVYKMALAQGYTGAKNIGELQKWQAQTNPKAVIDYYNSGVPLNAKHIDILKAQEKEVFEKAGIDPNKPSSLYTNEEKQKLKEASQIANQEDFILEGFQDGLWAYRFPMQSIQLNANRGQLNNISAPLPNLAKTPQQETVVIEGEEEQPKKDAQGNVILPPYDFLLPPSALQTIYKPQVGLNRATPMKTSVEPNLVALESQRLATQAQIAGLTPQQQAALNASFLGATQQNANQAISTVSAQNLAEQQKADFYNMAAGDKETLMNEQFNVGYQDKMAQSLSNQERDLRAYFNELNDINRFNYNFVDRRNLINQAFDNMKVDANGNVIATNLTNPLKGMMSFHKKQ